MKEQGYNLKESWDKRYQKKEWKASGTQSHTNKGNIQFYRAKRDALDRCLNTINRTFSGKDILDAAGGTGAFIDYYLGKGARSVTITDYSEVAIQLVKSKYKDNARVKACVGDLTAPFPEKLDKYDYIFVMEAIFLLPREDALRSALFNLASHLKTGGYLIISDLFGDKEYQPNSYVVYRPKSVFEAFLAEAGVRVVTYVPQTVLFNRRIFGVIQPLVENFGSLYYWLDRLAQAIGVCAPKNMDIKYLIGVREQ